MSRVAPLRASPSPIYDNCLAVDLKGNSLFGCDRRKMEWYLSRNLAEKISDDPPKIRLLFETAGPGHIGDPFFLEKRQNRCVVCGTNRKLTRHHILPHCYRRFLPRELDRYGSYDVMALCVDHHHEYEEVAKDYRKVLARDYAAPVNGVGGRACHATGRAVRAALALIRHGNDIPTEKKEWLQQRVIAFFGEMPSIDVLNRLIDRNRTPVKTHSEIVVGQLGDYDKIGEFVIRWRKHFVETMNPKFLPDHWDVERVFRP